MQRRDCFRITDVAFERMEMGECTLGSIEFPLIPAGHDDGVVTLMKLPRQLKAYTACSARYQNGFLVQLHSSLLHFLLDLECTAYTLFGKEGTTKFHTYQKES
jgi:hypothetical protein